MKKNQMPQIGLPADACERSGFTDKDTLELHAGPGALVFMKDKMTALEVANAIQSLSALAADLTVVLASACGLCDNCGEGCADDCPAGCVSACSLCHDLLDESQTVRIPAICWRKRVSPPTPSWKPIRTRTAAKSRWWRPISSRILPMCRPVFSPCWPKAACALRSWMS